MVRARDWDVYASHRRYIHGLMCIGGVCMIWVASSFVVKGLVNEGNLPPLLLTYISNALFVVLLPSALELQCSLCRGSSSNGASPSSPSASTSISSTPTSAASTAALARAQKHHHHSHNNKNGWNVYIRAAAYVCPLWFAAMFTYNTSLGLTNVTANTILSSTSSLFTYLLSVALLRERISAAKIGCILMAMVGSAMVTLAGRQTDGSKHADADGAGSAEWFGDLLCILSAFLYALYTVVMKRMLPAEPTSGGAGGGTNEGAGANLTRFFALLGVFNIAAFFPVVLIAALAGGIDIAKVPAQSIGIAVGKGLFDNVLSDFLWARAVLLTSPTVASVGLSVQIPIAMIAELLLAASPAARPVWMHSPAGVAMTLSGAVLVTLGFYGVAVATASSSQLSVETGAGSRGGGGGGGGGAEHEYENANLDEYASSATTWLLIRNDD